MSNFSPLLPGSKWFDGQPRNIITVNTNRDFNSNIIDSNVAETTLREAILYTQQNPGYYDIVFEKAKGNSSLVGHAKVHESLQLPYWTIPLRKPLPTIEKGNIRINNLNPKNVSLLPNNFVKKTDAQGSYIKDYQLVPNKGTSGSGSMLNVGKMNLFLGEWGEDETKLEWFNKNYPTVHIYGLNFLKNTAVGGNATGKGDGGSATGGGISLFSGDLLIQKSLFQDLGAKTGIRTGPWPKPGKDATRPSLCASTPATDGDSGGRGGTWSSGLGSGGSPGSGGSAGQRLKGETFGDDGGDGGQGSYGSGGGGGAPGGGAFIFSGICSIDELGWLTDRQNGQKFGKDGSGDTFAYGGAIAAHSLNIVNADQRTGAEKEHENSSRLVLSDVAFVNNKASDPAYDPGAFGATDSSIDTMYFMEQANSSYLPGPALFIDNIKIANRIDSSYTPFNNLDINAINQDATNFFAPIVDVIELPTNQSPIHYGVSSSKSDTHLKKPSDWNVLTNTPGDFDTNFITLEYPTSGSRKILSDQSRLNESIDNLYKLAYPDNSSSIEKSYQDSLNSAGVNAFKTGATGGLDYALEVSKVANPYTALGSVVLQTAFEYAETRHQADQDYRKQLAENKENQLKLSKHLKEKREITFEPINVLDQREVFYIKDFTIGEDKIILQNLPLSLGALAYTAGTSTTDGDVIHIEFTDSSGKNDARRFLQVELSQESNQLLSTISKLPANYFPSLAHTTDNPGEIILGQYANPVTLKEGDLTLGPANDTVYVKRTPGISDPFYITTNGGDDLIIGSLGDEDISAQQGNDRLIPRFGKDTLDGGSGTDMAVFSRAPVAIKAVENSLISIQNIDIFKKYSNRMPSDNSSLAGNMLNIVSADFSASRDKISINFSHALSPVIPLTRSFYLNSEEKVFSIDDFDVFNKSLTLSLDQAIPLNAEFVLSYSDPSINDDVNAIQDLEGNDISGFVLSSQVDINNQNGNSGLLKVDLASNATNVEIFDTVGDSFINLSSAPRTTSNLKINGYIVKTGLGSNVTGSSFDDHIKIEFDSNKMHPELFNSCAGSVINGGSGSNTLIIDVPDESFYQLQQATTDSESGVILMSVPGLGQTSLHFENIQNIKGLDTLTRKEFSSGTADAVSKPLDITVDKNLLISDPDQNFSWKNPDWVGPAFWHIFDKVPSSVIELKAPATVPSHFNRTNDGRNLYYYCSYGNVESFNRPGPVDTYGNTIYSDDPTSWEWCTGNMKLNRYPSDQWLRQYIAAGNNPETLYERRHETILLKVNSNADEVASYDDNIMSIREAYQLLHHYDLSTGDKVEIWDYRASNSPSGPIAVYDWSDLNAKNSGSKIPLISQQNMSLLLERREEEQLAQQETKRLKFEQLEQERLNKLGIEEANLLSSVCLTNSSSTASAPTASTAAMPFSTLNSRSEMQSSRLNSLKFSDDSKRNRLFDFSPNVSKNQLKKFGLGSLPSDLDFAVASSRNSYSNHSGLKASRMKRRYGDLFDSVGVRPRLRGTSSSDFLVGGRKSTSIHGRGRSDLLVGGRKDDKIFGGSGDDFLYGGLGRNRLHGGIGEDIFYLVPGGFQILQDFDFSNDKIRLASDMELSSLSFDESKQTLLYNSSPIAHFVNSL